MVAFVRERLSEDRCIFFPTPLAVFEALSARLSNQVEHAEARVARAILSTGLEAGASAIDLDIFIVFAAFDWLQLQESFLILTALKICQSHRSIAVSGMCTPWPRCLYFGLPVCETFRMGITISLESSMRDFPCCLNNMVAHATRWMSSGVCRQATTFEIW